MTDNLKAMLAACWSDGVERYAAHEVGYVELAERAASLWAAERERADLLAAEVRAWRMIGRFVQVNDEWLNSAERDALAAARAAVDAARAMEGTR